MGNKQKTKVKQEKEKEIEKEKENEIEKEKKKNRDKKRKRKIQETIVSPSRTEKQQSSNKIVYSILDQTNGIFSLTRQCQKMLSEENIKIVGQNATKIKVIDLSFNFFEDFSQINLTSMNLLTTINLTSNHFAGIPKELLNAPNLETLLLSYNKITSLPLELKKLKSLKVLDLSHNRIEHLKTDQKQIKNKKTIEQNPNHIFPDGLLHLDLSWNPLKNLLSKSESESERERENESECESECEKNIEKENKEEEQNGKKKDNKKKKEIKTEKEKENEIEIEKEKEIEIEKEKEKEKEDDNVKEIKTKKKEENKWLNCFPKTLKVLNLSHCKLKHLPNFFPLLTSLETLHLNHNEIVACDNSINFEKLRNLNRLFFQFNKIKEFPLFVFQSDSLLELDLSFNYFKTEKLPDSIAELTNLQSLRFIGNKLAELPTAIKSLQNLHCLYLRQNEIVKFPIEILSLKNLKILDLSGNRLSSLPNKKRKNVIQQLRSLIILNLSDNAFTKIPRQFFTLEQNLESVSFVGNPIKNKKELEAINYGNEFLQSYIDGQKPNDPNVKQCVGKKKKPKKNPELFRRYHAIKKFEALPLPEPLKSIGISKTLQLPNQNSTMLSKESLRDRILGLVFGQCLGDAIGLATEFMNKKQVRVYYDHMQISLEELVRDSHRSRWMRGDWTDDSDQMILILQSIIENNGKINILDFSKKLLNWSKSGFKELGDLGGMGIGNTVKTVLNHQDFLKEPMNVSKQVWINSGKNGAANGAVMRTSILAINQFWDQEKLIQNTQDICKVTHFDPRCRASCVFVSLVCAMFLQGTDQKQDLESIFSIASKHCRNIINSESLLDSKKKKLFINDFNTYVNAKDWISLRLDENKKIGYTFKCFASGVVALRLNKNKKGAKAFVNIMTQLIMEAGDADTNGAVAGAMLGCYMGFSNLPKEWILQMPHTNWLYAQMQVLFKMMGI
ncbi:hypothetical protein M0813_23161 [Anaeramoeba flamelloides]|uniref:Leucine rich repeat protein n=1 Tax=Anaeramoeba flamelloides TaxID=1746091 RepID=A0ABQ8Y9W9_9EUKA|nr:hypothetical protein M0813_23161 [Anaeramoeba flamelloides]